MTDESATMGTAVITGAAQGIGKAIAARLATDGYDLLLVDVAGELLEKTAAELGARFALVDIADEAQVATLTALAPDCSVLVNNAAIQRFDMLMDSSAANLRLVLDVNLVSNVLMAQALVESLERNAGRIVNFSSITAHAHPPQTGIYSASKAAVEHLTRALAVELGPRGIRVNAVAPGIVPTEGSDDHYGGPERRRKRAAVLPLRRLGVPEDIANAVAFFASAESSYITGQVITVDGGYQSSYGQLFRLARGDQ